MSTEREWVWLQDSVVAAVHEEQLAEHGGGTGVRDDKLLASALARPQQLAPYGQPDIGDLAAAYAFGIARNHPFIDGNKRTAFVACEWFLALNGAELIAPDANCVLAMLALAAGETDEATFGEWIRRHLQP
ncbi:MAG: type II toxin-antitoxin system death-on-curing family toxin [Burkholderiales bacterium]